MLTLGQYIFEYRKEHGMSIREFAARSGISHTYVSILEKGINTSGKAALPTVKVIKQVADATGKTVEELSEVCGEQIFRQGRDLTDRERLVEMINELPDEKVAALLAMLR